MSGRRRATHDGKWEAKQVGVHGSLSSAGICFVYDTVPAALKRPSVSGVTSSVTTSQLGPKFFTDRLGFGTDPLSRSHAASARRTLLLRVADTIMGTPAATHGYSSERTCNPITHARSR